MAQLSCSFLVLVANIVILTVVLTQARQFVLENFSVCPLDSGEPPVKANIVQLSTHKNKLVAVGSVVTTEELGKRDIIAKVDFKQCPTNNTCSGTTSIQVKEICSYLTGKSLFGNKFGQYFKPPIKCPVKPDTYGYNLTLNLKPLARLPLAKFRTYMKLTIVEKNIHNRERPLCCYDFFISMKD